LTNGTFDDTSGTRYSTVLGGLYSNPGWTNLSGNLSSAASMLQGQEGTAADAGENRGNRVLRLTDDVDNPANLGILVQNLGTMVAGETYTFTADAYGGASARTTWGATASLTADQAGTTVYAFQVVDGLAAGEVSIRAFNFSYQATASDDGSPLYIRLVAKDVGARQATRGGIDNAAITVTPAPAKRGAKEKNMKAPDRGADAVARTGQ
jgi:hypothetical protein